MITLACDNFVCEILPFTVLTTAFLFLPIPDVPIDAECSNDLECPNEKACIDLKCIDPCTLRGACGINALCKTVLHRPRCSCPQCYVGMANTICHPDSRCDSTQPRPSTNEFNCSGDEDCPTTLACNAQTGDCYNPCKNPTFSCRQNKKCEVQNHKAKCVCKNGFVVNEHGEISCANDNSECSNDNECTSNTACIEGRCQSPCTASKKSPCPADKSCEVLNHQTVCICMRNCNPVLSICLRDSGCPPSQACRAFKCEDPCETASCPAGTPCYVEDHKPVCKFCPPGFKSDSKYGCLKGKNTLQVPSCA